MRDHGSVSAAVRPMTAGTHARALAANGEGRPTFRPRNY